MQGLVTLDFGNTNPHAGLFQKSAQGWQLLKVVPFAELALYLSQLGMNANNTSLVLAQVKEREEELLPFIQEQGFLLTRLQDYWRGERFAGMPVHYAKTLGQDRLIEAYYIYKKHKIASLVIDAGTFVTMDVVSPQGFLGGYIIPGIETYFNTFQRGEQLRDVSLAHDFTQTLPNKTAEAMTESYTAFAALAEKIVREHKIEKIFITGGMAEVWKKLATFEGTTVETIPELIHHSLHYWFTTQIEPL